MLGGFSQVSKANEPGAYTNWTVEEHGSHGNDLEQFGQLLATLLGHCHGSSEYTQVCPQWLQPRVLLWLLLLLIAGAIRVLHYSVLDNSMLSTGKCRGLFLESPGNFSGPKSCFVFAVVAFKIKVSIILKMIQRKNQFTKQINRYVS